MMRKTTLRLVWAAVVFIFAAGFASAQAGQTVKIQTGPKGASYLTDASGMTLYYFTKDADGKSACYGGCATAWPVFYAPNLSLPSTLMASDFGSITRTDGSMQTTYKGWPLYYWAKDMKAGDMTGEGVGKVWYVLKVPAYTVMVATSATLGNYLVDATGMTLYWFTKDSVGQSACTGGCLTAWPAFTADSLVVPSGLNPADFATITRPDGGTQVTFKGYPLYYWFKDTKRGDTTGQDVQKVWYVIDPAKFPPAKM
jgi:predicted lipoprotein with Yx(FWY)xxD motif